jgi:hypothetical protein
MTGSSPHLTLAELTAGENRGDLPEAAAAHRDTCAACQARSRDAVADGVRFLVWRCQPSPSLMRGVFEAIDASPAPGRRRWLARRGHGSGRRVALAAAGAAVLLGGAGAGIGIALSPGSPTAQPAPSRSTAAMAGLTATGCSDLDLAGGTLQRVTRAGLVLAVGGGRQVTVTTSAGSRILREVTGTPADVTDGAHVVVSGTAGDGTIAARLVGILPRMSVSGPNPPSGFGGGLTVGIANGLVTGTRDGGFTVIEPDGTRVQVTMSSSSVVITAADSRLGQLRTGKITSAVGSVGPGGTLAAVTIEQDVLPPGALKIGLPAPAGLPGVGRPGSLPSGPPGPGALPSPPDGGHPFASLGCAPAAITSVDLLALGG